MPFSKFTKYSLKYSKVQIALAVSLILHICAAVFSVGYNWFDEYFQVVEFAGYKLGRTPVSSLPWEFGAQVRPWLEPSILFLISRFETFLGIHSPSLWLMSFQLFGAVLGWVSLLALTNCVKKWIPDPKRAELAILSLCVFWFLPWFHARTSSENYSSSCLFIGLWIWVARPSILKGAFLDFIGGVFWGFTFQFRIHVSAMILGGGVWLLKERKLRFIPAALGFLTVTLLAMGVDHWGYGQWSLTWWNYFDVCLLHHSAASFGTSPWWDYFRMMVVQSPPVLGVIVILICLVTWVKRPGHLVSWVSLPIVLAHMVLGHKELRYLFPVAPLVPIFPWLVLQGGVTKIEELIFKVVFALNVPFLLYGAMTAEKNSFRFLNYVADHFPDHFELYSLEPDPFEDVQTLYFLRPKDYHFYRITDAMQLFQVLPKPKEGGVHFYFASSYPVEAMNGPLGLCKPEFQTFGPIYRHFDFNHWLERAAGWQLLWCPTPGGF